MGLVPVATYIIGQRIQLLGHVMRRSEYDTIKVVIEWKREGKRWIDIDIY